MLKHLNIKVYGQVQGIFYRATAREEAEKLNITGFARNEPDESVYIEAEGEEEKLDHFIAWCHKGPPLANVEKVKTEEGFLKNFPSFDTY